MIRPLGWWPARLARVGRVARVVAAVAAVARMGRGVGCALLCGRDLRGRIGCGEAATPWPGTRDDAGWEAGLSGQNRTMRDE